jgi:Uma2 family endonuclease
MATLTQKEPLIISQDRLDEEFLVRKLLDSPLLIEYFEEIKHVLEAEHLKRRQFYNQITADQKAEFINGEVIIHSPARLKHNLASGRLHTLLSTYVTMHDLGLVGYEKMMISLTRNDYEPDICYFSKAKAQQFELDQWQFPAPDFIVEVLSDSTADHDRGTKFRDYAAHGVLEYWIIDPTEQTIEQYQLHDGRYTLLRKVDSGMLASIAVTGFILPVRAIFDEDEQEQKKALQNIIVPS